MWTLLGNYRRDVGPIVTLGFVTLDGDTWHTFRAVCTGGFIVVGSALTVQLRFGFVDADSQGARGINFSPMTAANQSRLASQGYAGAGALVAPNIFGAFGSMLPRCSVRAGVTVGGNYTFAVYHAAIRCADIGGPGYAGGALDGAKHVPGSTVPYWPRTRRRRRRRPR